MRVLMIALRHSALPSRPVLRACLPPPPGHPPAPYKQSLTGDDCLRASCGVCARHACTKCSGQSKLANVLFAQELSARVKDKNILVNSVHPGGVNTELGRHIELALASVLPTSAAQKIKAWWSVAGWHPRHAALTQLYARLPKPAHRPDRAARGMPKPLLVV